MSEESDLSWKIIEFPQSLGLEGVKELASFLKEGLNARRIALDGSYRVEIYEGHSPEEFMALKRLTIHGSNLAAIDFYLQPKPTGESLLYREMTFNSIPDYPREKHAEPELELLEDVCRATNQYFAERNSQRALWDAQEQVDRLKGRD